ncbi:hypothetical protein ElyMa_000766800 [Elysia marginata]|uniref:IGFBP N-terminal domain-containing protein n=1 Tax=Elysia marginata TaxID=1093978 RepID=A0AAV4GR63_9GAST|nr:hypothetical protein ElyMa_000766800 [Elysia marginata]
MASNTKPAGICEGKICAEEQKLQEPELEEWKRTPCVRGLVPPCRKPTTPPPPPKPKTPVPEPEMPKIPCIPAPRACRE